MNEELQSCLDAYLAVRDALGFANIAERLLLPHFVSFLKSRAWSGPIRAELALEWACQESERRGAAGQAQRLKIVRTFLRFLRATVPQTEVPGSGLVASPKRPRPYIFTDGEISALLSAFAKLSPRGSLRPHTYQALVKLLASTGLRCGEALKLKTADVELTSDTPFLRVLETKFRKSRLVPLHPTTALMLREYSYRRKKLRYEALSDLFFISEKGKALDRSVLWRTFKRVTKRLGMWPTDGRRRPTFHSFRHTFAVRRLERWYREGVDVRAMAPHLSIYLGHVNPEESYWYLTATPELLGAASESFERYSENGGAR